MSVQELATDLRCKIAIGPETQAWKRAVWTAALALALESYELGVSAALADGIATRYEDDRIARKRTEIARLSQGEPAKGRADTHTSPQTTQDATSGTGKHEAGT